MLTACGTAGAGGDAITRDEFIAANVALRRIAADSAGAAERRDSVLERQGVTAADLEAFVDLYAREPEALADVWTEIAEQLQDTVDVQVDSAHVDSAASLLSGTAPPAR